MNYASVVEADAYCEGKYPFPASWDDASDDDKLRALTTATRMIDRLEFAGDKASEDQELEFPRDDDTTVPTDIVNASIEQALALIDGADPDLERLSLGVTDSKTGDANTKYDRSFANERIVHGILSDIAWNYLKPYLRNSQEMTLERT